MCNFSRMLKGLPDVELNLLYWERRMTAERHGQYSRFLSVSPGRHFCPVRTSADPSSSYAVVGVRRSSGWVTDDARTVLTVVDLP